MPQDDAWHADLDGVLKDQAGSGAFPSFVDGPQGPVRDETCFVTAQVVVLLCQFRSRFRAKNQLADLDAAIAGGLDFVESCAVSAPAGAFAFYPQSLGTPRLDIDLPADADDTALAWLALMAGARRSAEDAQRILPDLFADAVVTASRRGDPPFVRRGLLRTWFGERGGINPVDLIVNINAIAALSAGGCDRDDFRTLIAAVVRALPMETPSGSHMRSVAPYYAHADELHYAVMRARTCGARLPVPSALLHGLVDATAELPLTRPLYCNAHGRPLWRAPVLQRARSLHRRLFVSQGVDPSIVSGGSHDVHAQIGSCRT